MLSLTRTFELLAKRTLADSALYETKVNSYVAESYAEFISGKVRNKNYDTNARGFADGRIV